MSNTTRNFLIVFVVVYVSAFASAQSSSPLDAIVRALDRNTRAQIRTCEAIHLQNQGEGTRGWHDAAAPGRFQWRNAQRCWR